MNHDSKKKVVFLIICSIALLEIIFYQYKFIQTKLNTAVTFKTINQVETNVDFSKEINITKLDIKLQENLKLATNKKVSFLSYLFLR